MMSFGWLLNCRSSHTMKSPSTCFMVYMPAIRASRRANPPSFEFDPSLAAVEILKLIRPGASTVYPAVCSSSARSSGNATFTEITPTPLHGDRSRESAGRKGVRLPGGSDAVLVLPCQYESAGFDEGDPNQRGVRRWRPVRRANTFSGQTERESVERAHYFFALYFAAMAEMCGQYGRTAFSFPLRVR